ncbi:MAG: Apocarotenoid-15,15'-oxygenase [Chloroflexaceae bacterium]|nr:Apocarotenoid-15,15'-oxygenase [Chloroflexaceae bacterium]
MLSFRSAQTKNAAIQNSKEQLQRDWLRNYESLKEENAYWIDAIEGEIPAALHGTLLRNGPALYDINGQRIMHPFDADGMVSSFAIANGRAFFRNRYVRTEGFVAEQQAGKVLYRGAFGTQKPGGWFNNVFDLRLKNLANTSVVYWGNRLLALWEAGEPHRLEPNTLETIGLDPLDGILCPGNEFSAHPRIDFHDGTPRMVTFGVKTGFTSQSVVTIYEFDEQWHVIHRHAYGLPGVMFMHDMAITPNHCIIVQNPIDYNPVPYLLGIRAAAQCLVARPDRPSLMVVIPRTGEGPMYTFETHSTFIYHHANAFEQGDEVVLDSLGYDSLPLNGSGPDFRDTDVMDFPAARLWRTRLNLKTGQASTQLLESRNCELPSYHPAREGQPYRYLYLSVAAQAQQDSPLQAILKLDLHTGSQQIWSAAPRGFVSEAVFVPRPGSEQLPPLDETKLDESTSAEDDGWLLVLVYDAARHRSSLAILDARNLVQGPVAWLHLRHHIPPTFHGTFVPEWFGPASA